jgi:hypothetical protein
MDAYKATTNRTGEINMTAIGGKHRKAKLPTQPQVVIQASADRNEYAKLGMDDQQRATLAWIGDPNAATKFDSRYSAKFRTREIDGIPETRVFHTLEKSA